MSVFESLCDKARGGSSWVLVSLWTKKVLMGIKKSKIPDDKILEILALLAENKKWDDIEYEVPCSRNTISKAKSWFNSLLWQEAEAFSQDSEKILSIRGDYLRGKAEEKQVRYLNYEPKVSRYTLVPVEADDVLSAVLETLKEEGAKNFYIDHDLESRVCSELEGEIMLIPLPQDKAIKYLEFRKALIVNHFTKLS